MRLRVGGRDVTVRAKISPFAIEIDGLSPSPDAQTRVEVDLFDRAGNGASVGVDPCPEHTVSARYYEWPVPNVGPRRAPTA